MPAPSRKQEREHAGSLSRVFVGEGRGEGRSGSWLNIDAEQERSSLLTLRNPVNPVTLR